MSETQSVEHRIGCPSRGAIVALAVIATATTETRANAQVHYDAGLQAGITRRFLTGIPDGAADASFGPSLMLEAHAAVVPMVRAGLYAAFDASPVAGAPARRMYAGGLHARIIPPILRSDSTYTWAGIGVGYVGVYAPSFHASVQSATSPTQVTDVLFDGAGGQFFEVPLSVGIAHKLRRPWEVFAELGARLGFAPSGALYTERTGRSALLPPISLAPAGNDTFAISLSVGIQTNL